MGLFSKQRLGIDLGTANTIIYIENKGIALREPSVVAVNKKNEEIVAYGKEALKLVGKTSNTYEIIRPIKDGVIANFSLTKSMLAHYVKTALTHGFTKPEVVICVPSNVSKVEKRAVVDTLKEIGISRAMVIEEAYAAAIGANLDINEPLGRMIVDIGGGTADIATISYGEIVNSVTIRSGGDMMNDSIIAMVRQHYQVQIGYHAAEAVKLSIGNAAYTDADAGDVYAVKGKYLSTGVPTEVELSAKMIALALDEAITQIVIGIKQVLEVTPPEISADIMSVGIIMTGGAAQLKRLAERLYDEIGIPVHLATHPLDCVAIGAGKMIKEMHQQSIQLERKLR